MNSIILPCAPTDMTGLRERRINGKIAPGYEKKSL